MHHDCKVHDLVQGSDEWLQARNGLLTASEVGLILTPTLKIANNDKTRAHVYEIAAQRISGYTEPTYIGDEMLRGHVDEIKAREAYSENYDPVEEVGFITRDIGGCVIGYSPDGSGVMGNFGIECKSRRQKYQVQVVADNEIPKEHILQVQTGLLVTGWDYIDYVSWSGGLPMWVIKSGPLPDYQDAIAGSAIDFEERVQEVARQYQGRIDSAATVVETERDIEQEMVI